MDLEFNKINKYFLNVGIIEAKNLNITNENTTVKVNVGKFEKEIHAKTKKTENPYFNESFRFEFFERKETFLKRRLRISVFKTKCRKFIGLCDIELASVWGERNYQYYHKWAILTDPKDVCSELKGYLKCDIQIIPEGYDPLPHVEENGNDIHNNLLIPTKDHLRRQNALFTINIYNADSISYKKKRCGNDIEISCNNLYVKVNFAGQSAKTRVVNKSSKPFWNQALHFVEAIPSLFQTISIELYDKKQNVCVGSAQLSLKDIGNSSDYGSLPSFGPSFLYLYTKDIQKHGVINFGGRIFISLYCQLLDRSNPPKLLKTTNISPLDQSQQPKLEKFSLFVGISQCIFFKKSYFKKCSIALLQDSKQTLVGNDDERGIVEYENDFIELKSSVKIDQYYSWWNKELMPYFLQNMVRPNTYDKEHRINFIKFFMNEIVQNLNELNALIDAGKNKKSREASNNILGKMESFCDKMLQLPPLEFETTLDKSKKENFNKLINKITHELETAKRNSYSPAEIEILLGKHVVLVLDETKGEQHTFAPIEIALIKKKKSKISQIFLNPADVFYSPDYRKAGCFNGKFQTVFFRNSNGDEVVFLNIFVWLGRQVNINNCFQFLGTLPKEDTLRSKELEMPEKHVFEMRVHIYQGKLNPGSDSSGLADPFVRVLAFDQVQESQVKAQTLDPFWDETLLFPSVTLYGSKNIIKSQSICIVFEIFDYDGPNNIEFIGRGTKCPEITFEGEAYFPPRLKKEIIFSHGEKTGEILITMELIETSLNKVALVPATPNMLFSIPDDIRPHFLRFQLEVIIWGARKYNLNTLPPFPRTLICLECNRVRIESSLVRAHQDFNFQFNISTAELQLPVEVEYSSPLSLSMYEFDYFSRPKYKGGVILPNIFKFRVKPIYHVDFSKIYEVFENVIQNIDPEIDENPDWWSKYYASKNKTRKTRLIHLYKNELEKQPEFDNFEDFLHSVFLVRGKTNVRSSQATFKNVATVKCAIALYLSSEIPNDKPIFQAYPDSEPLAFTVHVYIVAAYNLTATDVNGRCDPYISLSLGKVIKSDRRNYIFKDVNPVFGKCFEMKGSFPWDSTLKVSVMDHDVCLTDDLIGHTIIDLENRFYTKHRAMCGIPDTYETTGYCMWRDLLNPTEILEQSCKYNNIPPLKFNEESVIVGNTAIPLNGNNRESIALEILKNYHRVFGTGFHLVPEHLETRLLYHPEKPEIDQGQLEMWVDIFPGHSGIPQPVDITPRKPLNYQLRVVVWSVTDVLLSDISWLSGEKCSDIYVRAWLINPEDSQKTDIHYKSLTGEGSFNWRFIFPFVYSPFDHKMIIYQKVPFSLELWKEKIPCTLEVQVWDNDLLVDDFIGSLSLNLWDMPFGTKFSKICNLNYIETAARCSLFKLKKMRGWWPIRASNKSENNKTITGKIDLELELVTNSEAKLNPVGFGRDGPRPLPEPKRPSTSYVWSLSPLPFLKIIAFRGLRKKIFYTVCITALVVFIISGWLSIPALLLQKLI